MPKQSVKIYFQPFRISGLYFLLKKSFIQDVSKPLSSKTICTHLTILNSGIMDNSLNNMQEMSNNFCSIKKPSTKAFSPNISNMRDTSNPSFPTMSNSSFKGDTFNPTWLCPLAPPSPGCPPCQSHSPASCRRRKGWMQWWRRRWYRGWGNRMTK